MTQPHLFRYAALGDSTSVGVGANADGGFPERIGRRLKADGIPVGLLNLAVSGATSADLVASQLPRAVSRAPHLVTVGIGSNDAWRMVPDDVFGQRLRQIVAALEGTGAQIVLCNVADLGLAPAARAVQAWLGVTPELVTARVRQINRHFEALASRPRVTVVDLFSLSQQALRDEPGLFSPDGFHPSAKGYDLWAEVCWPAVASVASAWEMAA